MKQCGANGYMTVAGKPCQQWLKGKEEACLWHSRSADERSLLASRGTIAAKLKAALPESFVVPEELTRPATRKLIRDLVEWTLKKSSVDYKRVEVVKGLLGLVATLEQADETARLADAVLASTHGGESLVWLQQIQQLGRTPSRAQLGTTAVDAEGGA